MNQTVFTHNPFPKVGIRPIIDGRRRGVRESLEDQTMAMAKAAAKLISDNLKYPDGTPYVYEYKPAGSSAWVRVPATGFVASPNTTYDFRIAASANTLEGQAVQATYVPLTPKEREAGLKITASDFSIKASEVAGLTAAKLSSWPRRRPRTGAARRSPSRPTGAP